MRDRGADRHGGAAARDRLPDHAHGTRRAERRHRLSGRTKRKLGLDARAQWIIAAELNMFSWPGYELRSTPDGAALYGILPDPITVELRARVAGLQKAGRTRSMAR